MIYIFIDFDEMKCYYIQQKMKYVYYCEDVVSQKKINVKKLCLLKLKWYSNEKYVCCLCIILKVLDKGYLLQKIFLKDMFEIMVVLLILNIFIYNFIQ